MHSDPPRRAETVVLLGDRLCLDLVNSANWSGEAVLDETLERPEDAAVWAGRVLALTPEALAGWRAAPPAELAARLRACRGMIRSLCLACIEGTPPPGEALAGLNRLLGAVAVPRLAAAGGRFLCAPPDDPTGGWLVGVFARSALELLLSADRRALRVCPGERCGWIFLDRTRGRTRRWCRMETCGNRAKARTHYRRRREGAP
jgi:predicted RNA-binding Zn ribbon-like protein